MCHMSLLGVQIILKVGFALAKKVKQEVGKLAMATVLAGCRLALVACACLVRGYQVFVR